jgi:hypothetical protein
MRWAIALIVAVFLALPAVAQTVAESTDNKANCATQSVAFAPRSAKCDDRPTAGRPISPGAPLRTKGSPIPSVCPFLISDETYQDSISLQYLGVVLVELLWFARNLSECHGLPIYASSVNLWRIMSGTSTS